MDSSKENSFEKEIADACIAIVTEEKTNWEDAVFFVTEKVGFKMRELIRILRKNYWGVFDKPVDPNTGREKIWIGLIMATIENWVKNGDMDAKDIGFVARTKDGISITQLTRLIVKDFLDKMYFGEIVDTDQRSVLIDGTVVWKTWEQGGKLKRKTIDLLNFYIDPTEEDIQSAYRVTERALVLPSSLKKMKGWKNTDGLKGVQVLSKNESDLANLGTKTTAQYRDVWEMWGMIPKWLLNGDKNAEDAYEEVDGHIVVSGIESTEPTLHLVEENKNKDALGNIIKPYEEWRATKIANRWYGLGVAERILALQEYLNTIINIRINRAFVSQLGLFKIKKGKGITAQTLNRLPVNGAIQVSDMDDIQQFPVQEMGQSSYNDEEVIKYWAQQIASSQPVSSGELLPSSATATSAAISNTNAKSGYTLFKEGAGFFFERWIDRHALKTIVKTAEKGKLWKLMGTDESYKEIIEKIALMNVNEALATSAYIPTEQELQMAIANEEERLRKSPQIFIEQVQDIIASSLETKVKVTNEDLDTSVTIANLLQMMQFEVNNPEALEQSKKMVYDLMGLPAPKYSPLGQVQAQQGVSQNPNATDIMGSAVGVQ